MMVTWFPFCVSAGLAHFATHHLGRRTHKLKTTDEHERRQKKKAAWRPSQAPLPWLKSSPMCSRYGCTPFLIYQPKQCAKRAICGFCACRVLSSDAGKAQMGIPEPDRIDTRCDSAAYPLAIEPRRCKRDRRIHEAPAARSEEDGSRTRKLWLLLDIVAVLVARNN